MRICLLITFCCFLLFSAQAQIVNIPDANFKNALLNHNPVINTNNDGEIQVSEALAFTGTINVQYKSIATLIGIEAFTNLRSLDCSSNNLTALTISNLPQLTSLSVEQNIPLTSLTLTNLPALNSLSCKNGYSLASLALNNIPALLFLDCSANKITSLSLTNPGILQTLNCGNNKLTALPAGLSSLRNLECINNQISIFSLDNLSNLTYLGFGGNLCTSFSISNKPFLTDIICERNLLTSFTIANLPALKNLNCKDNQLTTLTLSGYPFLETVMCRNNQLTAFTVSNLPALKLLYCENNRLTSLSFTNFPLLQELQCSLNPLTSFTLSNLPSLIELGCGGSNLTSLNLPYLPALKYFSCSLSQLTSLSLINFPSLQRLSCFNNKITSFTLKNLPVLQEFDCFQNSFSSLSLDSLPSLYRINCGKNDSLTTLTLNLPSLGRLDCDSTNITSLDLSNTRVALSFLNKNPRLQYINFKNGTTIFAGTYYYDFVKCPALRFVCGDSIELTYINAALNTQLPGQNVAVSSLCNYTPGAFNSITGTVRFDGNNNGCNGQDSGMYNVKLKIISGTDTGYSFTNTRGKYSFFVTQNPNIVNPVFENNYFTATPSSQTINFTGLGNTTTADFCVTPNEVHPDLEIVLLPITNARPGFDAQYKLIYRNKGNQLQSGSVTLSFDAVKLSFLSAIPNVSNQTVGNLSWNYNGLTPYETRTITLTLHVNAPPAVNIGDILSFTATINPVAGDETPNDNTFNFNQVVRGSFDPNDKDVTEGSEIDISKVGDYLHYIIRFQNTGNDTAINVVVKDSLANNLDWNSLVPVEASHPYRTVISKGNKVEFIFDNINLVDKNTNEPASHGFVAFKIKPKTGINVGETISNKAEIYFDFNQPIITNTVTTKIVSPNLTRNLIALIAYPNPVKDEIRFSVKAGLKIRSVNLFNIVGERIYSEAVTSPGTDRKVNIAHLPTGILFLQVITNGGTATQKITRLK